MAHVTVTGINGPDGLKSLASAFDNAARVAPEQARKVVQKGLLNIKSDWRSEWTGLSNAPALASAVTYDTVQAGDRVSGEAGPDTDRRQGDLGNLVEYGSVNNAPHPGGLPALERERPRFAKALADLAAAELERRR